MSTRIEEEKRRRLDALLGDYAAVSRHLETEVDPSAEAKLKRRLLELEAEVRTLEAEIEEIGNADDHRFEVRYRTLVAKQLDYLELFGVSDRQAERYPLSPAYVRLSVGKPEEGRREPVEEVLGSGVCWLIRGDAGSGKTTLLRWLAVRAALNELPDGLASWGSPVPFFLRLRNFIDLESGKAALHLPTPEKWVNAVASTIAGMKPEGWEFRQLLAGRALILVDGVDEVPEALRPAVRDAIEEWQAAFEGCLFVVSSRPQLPERWLRDSEECEVARLGLAEAGELIDLWHETTARQVGDDERGPLQQLAARLKRALSESPQLRSLVESPLLCAMICALHRRNPHLPSSRIAVYTACCDAFLLRADPVPAAALEPALAWLHTEHINQLLEDLASWMVLNNLTDAPIEEVDSCLERTLADIPGRNAAGSAARVRQYLVERVALIHQPEANVVSFVHKTFMEYFAARGIVREDHIGLLLRFADDPVWEEVIRLAAGRTNREKSRRLVLGILSPGFIARPERRERRRLLALACLETCLALDPAVQKQVRHEIQKLLPPRSAAAARAIGAAGPLAVPYLAPQSGWSDAARAYAVQALGRIGDDTALAMLGRYAAEVGEPVFVTLVREWDRFDRRAYAAEVLARVHPQNGHWKPEWFTTLEGLELLPWLTDLDLADSPHLRDYSNLLSLPNLQRLTLPGVGVLKGEEIRSYLCGLARPAGTQEVNQRDGARLVWVPSNEFTMGANQGGHPGERPAHRVEISRGFWLYRTPVTNAQYARFLAAHPAQHQPAAWNDEDYSAPEQPVVGVSWEEAAAYCHWVGGRLPTEAEWEYAARGPEGKTYPWGEEPPTPERAVYEVSKPEAVGSRPAGASWCGALDLIGNVGEWCSDWYGEDYYQHSPARDPEGPAQGRWRIVRGGSPSLPPGFLRAAARNFCDPYNRHAGLGFRVVYQLPLDR